MSGRPYDDIEKAHQSATVEVEERFAGERVAFMRKLASKGLGHDEFTTQRMDHLRDWERRRKLAQKRLNNQFDPVHRKPQLLERDVEKELARLRKRIDAYKTRTKIQHDRADRHTEPARPTLGGGGVGDVSQTDSIPDSPEPRERVRSIEAVDIAAVAQILRETGMSDYELERTTDDELRAYYRRIYLDEESINARLAALNGRSS
jgi:hypothetical protein